MARYFALSVLAGLAMAATAVTAARADDDPTAIKPEDYEVLQNCLEVAHGQGSSGDACVGLASQACFETPEGQSGPGMVACAMREHKFWDEQLNFAYGELRKILDKPAADELRQVQRLWISYRDAACAFPVALYGGGTGEKVEMALCEMRETGRRAADLGAYLDLLAERR